MLMITLLPLFAQLFFYFFFFFNDTATTEIYTLSLHDALPIATSGNDANGELRAPGSRGGLPRYVPRARAVPVPQGVGRRARRRPRSGGVRPSAGAQTGERAGVALHRGGKHGAGRCATRGA